MPLSIVILAAGQGKRMNSDLPKVLQPLAGKPLVRVVPLDAPDPGNNPRIGFMAGRIRVPDDFDSMGGDAIGTLFEDP